MRKSILLLVMTISMCYVYGQNVDTVFVNIHNSTYIICNDSVAYFNIGSKEYIGAIHDNAFFLKPKKENTLTTTLLVKAGDKYLNLIVAYSNLNKKWFYDFRNNATSERVNTKGTSQNIVVKSSLNNKSSNSNKAEKENSDNNRVVEDNRKKAKPISTPIEKDTTQDMVSNEYDIELEDFMKVVSPYRSIAIEKDRVILSLGNIYQKAGVLYIKISITNYRKKSYTLESMDVFFYKKGEDLVGNSKGVVQKLQVLSKNETDSDIKTGESVVYGIALDGTPVNNKGKLYIRVSEVENNKLISLEVPSLIIPKMQSDEK